MELQTRLTLRHVEAFILFLVCFHLVQAPSSFQGPRRSRSNYRGSNTNQRRTRSYEQPHSTQNYQSMYTERRRRTSSRSYQNSRQSPHPPPVNHQDRGYFRPHQERSVLFGSDSQSEVQYYRPSQYGNYDTRQSSRDRNYLPRSPLGASSYQPIHPINYQQRGELNVRSQREPRGLRTRTDLRPQPDVRPRSYRARQQYSPHPQPVNKVKTSKYSQRQSTSGRRLIIHDYQQYPLELFKVVKQQQYQYDKFQIPPLPKISQPQIFPRVRPQLPLPPQIRPIPQPLPIIPQPFIRPRPLKVNTLISQNTKLHPNIPTTILSESQFRDFNNRPGTSNSLTIPFQGWSHFPEELRHALVDQHQNKIPHLVRTNQGQRKLVGATLIMDEGLGFLDQVFPSQTTATSQQIMLQDLQGQSYYSQLHKHQLIAPKNIHLKQLSQLQAKYNLKIAAQRRHKAQSQIIRHQQNLQKILQKLQQLAVPIQIRGYQDSKLQIQRKNNLIKYQRRRNGVINALQMAKEILQQQILLWQPGQYQNYIRQYQKQSSTSTQGADDVFTEHQVKSPPFVPIEGQTKTLERMKKDLIKAKEQLARMLQIQSHSQQEQSTLKILIQQRRQILKRKQAEIRKVQHQLGGIEASNIISTPQSQSSLTSGSPRDQRSPIQTTSTTEKRSSIKLPSPITATSRFTPSFEQGSTSLPTSMQSSQLTLPTLISSPGIKLPSLIRIQTTGQFSPSGSLRPIKIQPLPHQPQVPGMPAKKSVSFEDVKGRISPSLPEINVQTQIQPKSPAGSADKTSQSSSLPTSPQKQSPTSSQSMSEEQKQNLKQKLSILHMQLKGKKTFSKSPQAEKRQQQIQRNRMTQIRRQSQVILDLEKNEKQKAQKAKKAKLSIQQQLKARKTRKAKVKDIKQLDNQQSKQTGAKPIQEKQDQSSQTIVPKQPSQKAPNVIMTSLAGGIQQRGQKVSGDPQRKGGQDGGKQPSKDRQQPPLDQGGSKQEKGAAGGGGDDGGGDDSSDSSDQEDPKPKKPKQQLQDEHELFMKQYQAYVSRLQGTTTQQLGKQYTLMIQKNQHYSQANAKLKKVRSQRTQADIQPKDLINRQYLNQNQKKKILQENYIRIAFLKSQIQQNAVVIETNRRQYPNLQQQIQQQSDFRKRKTLQSILLLLNKYKSTITKCQNLLKTEFEKWSPGQFREAVVKYQLDKIEMREQQQLFFKMENYFDITQTIQQSEQYQSLTSISPKDIFAKNMFTDDNQFQNWSKLPPESVQKIKSLTNYQWQMVNRQQFWNIRSSYLEALQINQQLGPLQQVIFKLRNAISKFTSLEDKQDAIFSLKLYQRVMGYSNLRSQIKQKLTGLEKSMFNFLPGQREISLLASESHKTQNQQLLLQVGITLSDFQQTQFDTKGKILPRSKQPKQKEWIPIEMFLNPFVETKLAKSILQRQYYALKQICNAFSEAKQRFTELQLKYKRQSTDLQQKINFQNFLTGAKQTQIASLKLKHETQMKDIEKQIAENKQIMTKKGIFSEQARQANAKITLLERLKTEKIQAYVSKSSQLKKQCLASIDIANQQKLKLSRLTSHKQLLQRQLRLATEKKKQVLPKWNPPMVLFAYQVFDGPTQKIFKKRPTREAVAVPLFKNTPDIIQSIPGDSLDGVFSALKTQFTREHRTELGSLQLVSVQQLVQYYTNNAQGGSLSVKPQPTQLSVLLNTMGISTNR